MEVRCAGGVLHGYGGGLANVTAVTDGLPSHREGLCEKCRVAFATTTPGSSHDFLLRHAGASVGPVYGDKQM